MAESPAVVLLSGGLDSATVLALAKREGFVPQCLSFSYGQRHGVELVAARRVAAAMGVERHVEIDIDPAVLAGSALTDDIAVPRRSGAEMPGDGIPVTYVPARNTIFLSYGLALAESIGAWRPLHRRQLAGLQRIPRLPPGVHRGVRGHGQPRDEGSGGGLPADARSEHH